MTKRILSAMCACLILAAGFCTQTFSQVVTLEQAIRDVCTKSDSVKMMKESVIRSDQMVREKWANALPVVSATAYGAESYGSLFSQSSGGSSSPSRSLDKEASTFTPNDSGALASIESMLQSFSTLGNPQTSTIYSAGLSFSQPIFTFGKIGTAIKVANEFSRSAHLTYSRNLQTLQLTALDMFFATVYAEKLRGIQERTVARKKELYEFANRNFQMGSGAKATVLSAKSDFTKESANLIKANRNALQSRMFLNSFMGRQLTDMSSLDTSMELPGLMSTSIPDPDKAVGVALDNRPELKSLKLYAEANRGGAKIFKAMYLPSIAATGSAGWSKYSGNQLFSNSGATNWTLGIGAQWTLFDGFYNSAKAQEYLSDARKLETTCDVLSKGIEIEIRSDIKDCAVFDSTYQSSKEAFSSALESYNLTNDNFKAGSGAFSDLKLADESLQQAEVGLIQARFNQMRSRAALLVALGNDIIKIN
jgi:outer membrane protein